MSSHFRRLQGAPLDGLPQTVYGFIPVDSHCRVHGVTDVFAAGDITSFTVKQGGIAAQQADVAAAAIAAAAGRERHAYSAFNRCSVGCF